MKAIVFDRTGQPELAKISETVRGGVAALLDSVGGPIRQAHARRFGHAGGSLPMGSRIGSRPLPVNSIFAPPDFRAALAAEAQRGRRGKILLT